MSLSANLFALLMCAAAANGGDQPARGTEAVQEKITVRELRQRLEELRDGQLEVILATRDLLREMAIKDPWRSGPTDVTRVKPLAKQHELSRAAEALIARLQAEGMAVAFVEVFQQVHRDMSTVAARLEKTDVGPATRALQRDIVDTLEEMIRATKSR
jgi:hypothetical protein